MAVAAPALDTKSAARAGASPLWIASLVGAIFVIVGLAVVVYGLPRVWGMGIGEFLRSNISPFANSALALLVQVAALVALAIFGINLAGRDRPGIHGGISLTIAILFLLFFVSRGIGMFAQRAFGLVDSIAFGVFLGAILSLGFFTFKFFRSSTFLSWANGIEFAGFFSTNQYKRNLGIRVRRFTILGILLIFGTGVYTLMENGWLDGSADWEIYTSFLGSFTLLPDVRFTVPLLLLGLGIWLAWRLVNEPQFADFLIATEAEINKVSWPTRKQLIRDTIVVLVALALFTIFFFIVDVFWGWLLSRSFIGVLPQPDPNAITTGIDTPMLP